MKRMCETVVRSPSSTCSLCGENRDGHVERIGQSAELTLGGIAHAPNRKAVVARIALAARARLRGPIGQGVSKPSSGSTLPEAKERAAHRSCNPTKCLLNAAFDLRCQDRVRPPSLPSKKALLVDWFLVGGGAFVVEAGGAKSAICARLCPMGGACRRLSRCILRAAENGESVDPGPGHVFASVSLPNGRPG